MAEDRAWERIVDAIDTKFGLTGHGRSSRPVHDAQNLTEQVAFITFDRQGIEYRLERVTGPAVVDKRSVGSRRIGGTTHMQTIYDPEETAARTLVFRRDGAGEWEPIGLEELGL